MRYPINYLIDYEVFDGDNISLKRGQIKVKNRFSEFEAKCSLEGYLKKKYRNFDRLVIINCKNSTNAFFGKMDGFEDLLNIFK